MKWPAIVRFESSDELEIIDSQVCWDTFLDSISTDCQLILSDGALCDITINKDNRPAIAESNESISTEAAVSLARAHMATQGHCCVSKFNAPTVEDVIKALSQLDD